MNQIRDVLISESTTSTYLVPSSLTASSAFPGIRLALVGDSGCGKTSLMAKIAQVVHLSQQAFTEDVLRNRPIVIRFCGTSESGQFCGYVPRTSVGANCQLSLVFCQLSPDSVR